MTIVRLWASSQSPKDPSSAAARVGNSSRIMIGMINSDAASNA